MDETIQIPGYIIERNLGSGAMATVYLATQQTLERKIALKLMSSSLVADGTFRERFLKEGKIIAKLNHPNIVTIYDIGVFQSNYYMAMEYVEGATLKDRMSQGVSADEAVDIICQVAGALGYAHRRNFVHRDVKPANILFRAEDGQVILSDFGIAKVLGDGTQLTQQGWAMGTPNYMSPEQALGQTIDERSDLYALGVVFYEMLTGNKPYQAQDSFAVALMHVNDPIPQLPEKFAAYQPIIDRAMAKKPEDRYADASALIEDLKRIHSAAGGHLGESAAMAIDRNARNARDGTIHAGKLPTRTLAWAGSALGAVALAVAGFFVWQFTNASGGKTADPCAQPAVLSLEQQSEIAQRLEVALVHHEVGNLVGPPVSNAAHGYREILQIDPCNVQAQQGLKTIAGHYKEQAEACLTRNENLNDCLNLAENGLTAAPDNAELLQLKQQIGQKITQN